MIPVTNPEAGDGHSAWRGRAAPRAVALAFFAALACVGLLAMIKYHGYYGHTLNGWDAQFYFAAARAMVFGNTFDITGHLRETPWVEPFRKDGDAFGAVPKGPDGRFQSKYTLGLPLVESFFLGLGFALRKVLEAAGLRLTGPPGLSTMEISLVALGLMLLPLLGLWRLARLTPSLTPYPPLAYAALGGAYFGTTLFYYSAIFPFMAHGLGFTASVLWVAEAKALREDEKAGKTNRHFLCLGLLAGMLFLIRPQQVLLPLFTLPLLLPSLLKPWRSWLPGVIFGGLASACAIALTLFYNESQFGVFSLNSYQESGEGFDFLRPQLAYVLWGSERGLFYYSPLALLALPGLFALAGQKRHAWAWPAMANGLAQIYLVAAWWTPRQGDSFGMRMWTESVLIVALGLCALPWQKKAWVRGLCLVLILASCAWTSFLTLRYLSWI